MHPSSISAPSVIQSIIIYLIVIVLFANRAIGQVIQVTTPSGAVVCQYFPITWSGGTAPYVLSIDDISSGLHIFTDHDAANSNYMFESFVAASSAVITITDSLNNVGRSFPFVISPGSQTCGASSIPPPPSQTPSSPAPSPSPSGKIQVAAPVNATVCRYFPVKWTGGTAPFILSLDDTSNGLHIYTDTIPDDLGYMIESSISATAAVITIIDSLDSFGKSSPFTISGPPGVQNCIPVVSTTSLLPPPPISTPPPSLSSTPTRTSSGSIATYTPIFPPSPSPGTKNSSVTADDPRVVLHGQAWRTSTTNCSSSGSKVSKQCTDRGLSLNFTFDGTAVYMWTSLAATSGTCSVAIDKQAAVSIDGFSAQPVCLIAWSAFGLGGGTHSVVVTNLGQSELASSKGQDNATLYQLDAFTITTTDSTSSGSTIGTSNSLYLLSILISLFVYPRVS